MHKIIFLDMDGVLNGDLFYTDWIAKHKEEYYQKTHRHMTNRKANDHFMDKFYIYAVGSQYNGFVAPDNLERWNRLIDSVKADVVFSSDWKMFRAEGPERLATPEEINQLFKARGLHGNCIGVTQRHLSYHRGLEIKCWLMDNEETDPEGRRVLVLDDLPEVNDIANYTKYCSSFYFINTNPALGLTDENVEDAINYFNEGQK